MVKVLALIAAIALHALIMLALLFGVRLPKPEPAPEPPVQARLVRPAEPTALPPTAATPAEPAPVVPPPLPPEATPPRQEVTPPEPQTPRPEPRPAPVQRPAPKPVEKPVAKPKPQEKPQPSRPDESAVRQRAQQAELAEKARAEQVRQEAERERAERLRADMAADELRERLARESATPAPAPQRVEDISAIIGKYKGQIRERVRRYWSSDALRPGLSTAVRVRLDPRGNVLTARTVRSSGSREFDQAVEAAVMRASPLPIPSRPDLYQEFREIDFTFSAKDFDNA